MEFDSIYAFNPAQQEIGLENFLTNYREVICDKLVKNGAILLEGLSVDSASKLSLVMEKLFPNTARYKGGNSPRKNVSGDVYTSTELPASRSISLHNELSYMNSWPSKIVFCCVEPAQSGGATPIADSRAILDAVPTEVLSRFRDRGLIYTQKLHGGQGVGKSWQDTFETEDRVEVEQFAAANGIQMDWTEDGGIRLAYKRKATERHPHTGHELWFNQAEQWHPSQLSPEVRKAMEYTFKPEDMPHNVFFGDGSPISDEDCLAIRKSQEQCAMRRTWKSGDLLILDNMLMAHARDPFEGGRRILVSMAW